jgi:hypothetical protein
MSMKDELGTLNLELKVEYDFSPPTWMNVIFSWMNFIYDLDKIKLHDRKFIGPT